MMTADERLALVRLKIERADHHIDNLKVAIKSFHSTNPYEVHAKRDPQTRKPVYYIGSAQPVPVAISLIAGDALHCLRDALDHLAQQLYLVGTGNANGYSSKTSFLIADSAKYFKSHIARKVDGMRQDAIDAICAIEPYLGGKGADLWPLDRLNNIDKHRLILTVGVTFAGVDIGGDLTSSMEKLTGEKFDLFELFICESSLIPLEVGTELYIGAVDEELKKDRKFRFDVAIYEVGLIQGKSAFETIVQFRNRVDGIVESFRPCLR